MQRCSKCGIEKPLAEFNRDKRRPNGRGSYCSECHNAAARLRKAVHVPPAVGERTCSTCGETKPLTEYGRRKDSPCGFRAACKPCKREADRLASQRWLAANHEKGVEKGRKWREENREQERERCARYDTANREQRRQAIAQSRQQNPEHHRALGRAWNKANPGKRRDIWYRWYEGTQNPSPETAAYIDMLLSDPCCYCGGPMQDIDHIEPRSLGGVHDWTNLTGSCASCNRSKGKRPLLLWLSNRPDFLHRAPY